MNNYIPDRNRFNLAGPPKSWLKKLWEFDPSLVVIPSRKDFVYRLAQRRPMRVSATIVNDIMGEDADTKMLAEHGLVPVTTIIATANWDNPLMFHELANRAPWRLGGADKVNAMLEEQDMKAELDRRAQTDEHLSYLGRDAWNLYLKKIGVRTSMYSPKTKGPSRPKGPMIRIA